MLHTLQTDEEAEKEEEEDAPTTKKITVTEKDWEQLNTQNAIWLRSPSDVTTEEYEKFYKAVSKVHPLELLIENCRPKFEMLRVMCVDETHLTTCQDVLRPCSGARTASTVISLD